MSRGIKVKVRCCLCRKWRFHTAFHIRARGFICRWCGQFMEENPHFKNLPFKGWGHHPPKQKEVTA